jgi:purine-binding chemotaxis protein CheW
VPGAPQRVRGLAALRSRVVTVIDTRVALGLPSTDDASARAVITVVDGHHYAVLVDTLDDIAPFELLPLSSGLVLDGGWQLAARGIIERDGEAMLAISLAAIVPAAAAIAA